MSATFILSSMLATHEKDENGNRYPIVIKNTNGIVDAINKYCPNKGLFVWVCNIEDSPEENDIRANTVFESFNMSNLAFDKYVILDGRTIKDAKELIKNANFILLSGGKITTQKLFLDKINMKELLKDTNALVVGTSAGAMNLGYNIYNFPEEPEDIDEPRIVEGLGVFDGYIIPHFEGKTMTYQLPYHTIDSVNDYILPFSYEQELLAIDNDAYIIFDRKDTTYHGNCYLLKNGKATLIVK